MKDRAVLLLVLVYHHAVLGNIFGSFTLLKGKEYLKDIYGILTCMINFSYTSR